MFPHSPPKFAVQCSPADCSDYEAPTLRFKVLALRVVGVGIAVRDLEFTADLRYFPW